MEEFAYKAMQQLGVPIGMLLLALLALRGLFGLYVKRQAEWDQKRDELEKRYLEERERDRDAHLAALERMGTRIEAHTHSLDTLGDTIRDLARDRGGRVA